MAFDFDFCSFFNLTLFIYYMEKVSLTMNLHPVKMKNKRHLTSKFHFLIQRYGNCHCLLNVDRRLINSPNFPINNASPLINCLFWEIKTEIQILATFTHPHSEGNNRNQANLCDSVALTHRWMSTTHLLIHGASNHAALPRTASADVC